jgi:hypothetical protein
MGLFLFATASRPALGPTQPLVQGVPGALFLGVKWPGPCWVPCHHSMARPQVADGREVLRVRRVAANILNKQSRTAEKGWSFRLGVGHGADNPSP